jgi:hypothetical protein
MDSWPDHSASNLWSPSLQVCFIPIVLFLGGLHEDTSHLPILSMLTYNEEDHGEQSILNEAKVEKFKKEGAWARSRQSLGSPPNFVNLM